MFGWLKKSATYNLSDLQEIGGLLGWFGWGSSAGVTVNRETALQVSAVFCAARVIAEGLAQMPVRVVSETFDAKSGRGDLRIERAHWAHRLLAQKPNDWQTSYEFREGMIFCAALTGGALAIKNKRGGEIRELLPVAPGSWTVEQRSDWGLVIKVTHGDKDHSVFGLDDVFYLRGPSLNGFAGLEAVKLAKEVIGLSTALERQQARLAGNGGKPSGILSYKEKLSPEAAANLKAHWQKTFGAGGEGGIALLDRDAAFSAMTMTSVDAQFIETRRMQIEEVARVFRVLPIMIMQADKASTYASAEQMFRMHVIHTLGPWIERFEQAANRDVLGNDEKLRVDLDERNLLRGDFKDQSEYYTKALGAGGQPAWMTPNEVRAEVGLNPISAPWADDLPRGAMNQDQTKPSGANDGAV